MRRMMEDQEVTGQRELSPVRCMVMVTSRSSFFWYSNVMETLSARWSVGSLWCSSRWSWKNHVFLRVRSLVRCSAESGTLQYSQEHMAKKKAPVASWLMASSRVVWQTVMSS